MLCMLVDLHGLLGCDKGLQCLDKQFVRKLRQNYSDIRFSTYFSMININSSFANALQCENSMLCTFISL